MSGCAREKIAECNRRLVSPVASLETLSAGGLCEEFCVSIHALLVPPWAGDPGWMPTRSILMSLVKKAANGLE